MVSLLGGIIGAVILVLPLQTVLLSGVSYPLFLVLVVGVTEEAFKPIGLAIVARKRSQWLALKRDYLIAGALAGIGFAFIENLLYYLRFGAATLLARTGITLPLHAGMSAFVGVGIYFAAVKKEYSKFIWLLAFAATIHAIYDYIYLLSI
jgi:RsiW-degrading membrane proteinase PrsW (M82 family)